MCYVKSSIVSATHLNLLRVGMDSSIEKSGLLEYKPRNDDDGWYIFSISLHNGKLVIHHERLLERQDEELDLAKLKSVEDLYAMFHHSSTQLKDKECRKLVPMWSVLVSYTPPIDHGGPLKEPNSIHDSIEYRYFNAHLKQIKLHFQFFSGKFVLYIVPINKAKVLGLVLGLFDVHIFPLFYIKKKFN